jgi:hypothetical protein
MSNQLLKGSEPKSPFEGICEPHLMNENILTQVA